MFSVIVLIVCFQFFRKYIRSMDAEVDKIDISPEDYTVLVRDIPLDY